MGGGGLRQRPASFGTLQTCLFFEQTTTRGRPVSEALSLTSKTAVSQSDDQGPSAADQADHPAANAGAAAVAAYG
jgi:hypothetical protein